MKHVAITRAFDDRNLFGSVLRDSATWQAWRSFLCALFACHVSPLYGAR
jgi:hypothetical protein